MTWADEFPDVWEVVRTLPSPPKETPARVLYGTVRARLQPEIVVVGNYFDPVAVLLGSAAAKVGGRVFCTCPSHLPTGQFPSDLLWQHFDWAQVCDPGRWDGPIDVLYLTDPMDYAAWSPFVVSDGVCFMKCANRSAFPQLGWRNVTVFGDDLIGASRHGNLC